MIPVARRSCRGNDPVTLLRTRNQEIHMLELIVVSIVIGLLAVAVYKSGKRDGSKKGYSVGLRRGKRPR